MRSTLRVRNRPRPCDEPKHGAIYPRRSFDYRTGRHGHNIVATDSAPATLPRTTPKTPSPRRRRSTFGSCCDRGEVLGGRTVVDVKVSPASLPRSTTTATDTSVPPPLCQRHGCAYVRFVHTHRRRLYSVVVPLRTSGKIKKKII